MKKSVVYLSAFVMLIAVIAMSVGFSAAWFANVTESSSPILIGADNGTAYVTIDTSNSSITGIMKPAILNDGYLISADYDPQKVVQVLAPAGGSIDSTVFKSGAQKATYKTSFTFDGQPNIATDKRKVFISIEGIYLVEPTVFSNGQYIPRPDLGQFVNYIDEIGYKLSATSCTTIGDNNGDNKLLAIQSPIKQAVELTGEFYYKQADELLPSVLVNKNLFILVKIHALEANNG